MVGKRVKTATWFAAFLFGTVVGLGASGPHAASSADVDQLHTELRQLKADLRGMQALLDTTLLAQRRLMATLDRGATALPDGTHAAVRYHSVPRPPSWPPPANPAAAPAGSATGD